MNAAERQREATSTAHSLRLLASLVEQARLNNNRRILDASDFKQWLMELADAMETQPS